MTFDDTFGHWLAGFADGEGCFSISPSAGRGYVFTFGVMLRDDDRAILEECQARTGLGRVVSSPGRGTSNPQAKWEVNRKLDCFLLVALFDTYPLRAKKARDYALWREGVLLWQSIVPRKPTNDRPVDWTRIGELRDEIRTGRQHQAA